MLADAPFRGTEVKEEWPYLGVTVAGPASLHCPRRWDPTPLRRIRIGTWARARTRMHDRAAALAATTCSQGRRAMAWNTYIVPLVPYPAHVTLPTQVQTRDMRQDLSLTLRHDQSRWCPLYVLSGLAILYGIRSAPKCPVTTALAVGASAWVRHDTWGPAPLAAALQQPWLAAVRWARRPTPTWIPPRQQQTLRKAADLILQAEWSHFWEPRTALPRALLQALYTALWTATHGQQAYSWFTMRSAARK